MSVDRIGQYSDVASLGVATDAGNAFAAGDLVGDKLTISVDRFFGKAAGFFGKDANVVRTGIIQSVTVVDQARQAAEFDLILFDSDPSSTTFTPNAALNISSIDMAKIIGQISISSTDYSNVASGSVGTVVNAGLHFRTAQNSGNIFGALVARSAPTYPGSADLGLRIGMEQH